MTQFEGRGWRLERDTSKRKFTVLIGAKDCSVELLETEWDSLCGIVFDLIDEHRKLKNNLMAEEEICLEMERYPWWACIDGTRESWSLKVILSSENEERRGLELFWPIPTAQVFVAAMRTMWDSTQ